MGTIMGWLTGGLAEAAPLRRLEDGSVALSFDDGPDPRHTPQILDLLGAARVQATFFVIAGQAVRHPQLVRRMLNEGHAVGSHGWSHRHPWTLGAAAAHAEVSKAGEALAELTGEAARWFRPPHGRLHPSMLAAAREQGQRVALWTRSAIDWGPWATPQAVQRRLCRVRRGEILLMHDGRNRHNRPQATAAALPRLVATLAERGLRTVRLD